MGKHLRRRVAKLAGRVTARSDERASERERRTDGDDTWKRDCLHVDGKDEHVEVMFHVVP